MVPRPAQVRVRAPRRIWHGHRTRGDMDMRSGTCSGDHSISKDVVSVDAMSSSRISIIGVPMDLGADRRGVDMGPSALRYSNLNEHLTGLEYDVQDLGDIDVMIPETQHFG